MVLLVLLVLMLRVVVMVHNARPGMVRRMVVWRRQTLRWMRVMLRATVSVLLRKSNDNGVWRSCREAKEEEERWTLVGVRGCGLRFA